MAETKKKSKPTPKRKKQESKNLRPIVDSAVTKKKVRAKDLTPEEREKLKLEKKEANQKRRQENYILREKQYEAMKTGDERYLPEKDRGPVRKFIRNEVDKTHGIAELFLPTAIVFMISTQLLQTSFPQYAFLFTVLVYIYLFAVAVELFVKWRIIRKKLIDKFGANKLEKGMAMYAVTRISQIGFARSPKKGV